jgi:hypothetical protein
MPQSNEITTANLANDVQITDQKPTQEERKEDLTRVPEQVKLIEERPTDSGI